MASLGSKLRTYASPAAWAHGFDSTDKTWLLHLTGGEPSIYPSFADLCEHLTRKHYLSLNSNLSHRSLDDFAERIDPDRVHFINGSVHYEERRKRGDLRAFIERVRRLQRRGFNVLVSLLMTPTMCSVFPELRDHFASQGLFLIPKMLTGKYRGRRYPRAYSNDEKAAFTDYLAEARRRYAPVLARMGEPPTIDMLSVNPYVYKKGKYRGQMCGSGFNFVGINPDGTVQRCGSGEYLGNILLETLSLNESPKRCNTEYCPYFCEKYTSAKFAHSPTGSGRPVRRRMRVVSGGTRVASRV